MADLSTQTTFSPSVQGNKRVVYCDVSGTGTSTADLIVVPLKAVDFAVACFRSGAGSSSQPVIGISGTTLNVFTATTGVSYTIKAEGR